MRPVLTTAAVLLLGALSAGLYLLENETQRLQRHLAGLDRQLIGVEKSIQVLEAEWSYLNRPERLQDLAVRYVDRLGLKPIQPAQTGPLAVLPRRQAGGGAGSLPRPAFKPPPPKGLLLVGTGQNQ
jgi:hypothetical protein